MSKRRRFKLEDLSAEHQVHARRQLAGPVEPRLLLDGVEPEAPKGKRGGPSKNERDYQRHLVLLERTGEVVYFLAQPAPIELAHRCTYQPDFLVMPATGTKFYVEVKGRKGKRPWYRDDGARVKTKVAARVLSRRGDPPGSSPLSLVVVWPRNGGGWCSEVVKP